MNWLELKIDTAPAGLDAVTELLEDLGVTGLVINDEAGDTELLQQIRHRVQPGGGGVDFQLQPVHQRSRPTKNRPMVPGPV
jgi:ribosomal protein L11 methylase PrmA